MMLSRLLAALFTASVVVGAGGAGGMRGMALGDWRTGAWKWEQRTGTSVNNVASRRLGAVSGEYGKGGR